MIDKDGLEPKQAQFVVEYLKDFNGTKAAERAGYSKRGASQTGSRLLANPKVQSAIKRRAERVLERAEFTADDVLKEAALIAFADIRRLFDANGKLLPPHLLEPDIAKAVATYKVDKDGRVEVKLTPKDKGLELLARYYGLLKDRMDVNFGIDQALLATLPPDRLAEVKQAAQSAAAILATLKGGPTS